MSEHIITREMLVSTLSDVMRERDAAKKDATQWHDDWVTLNQQRVQLLEERSRLERALADEKARSSREMTVIQEELRIARKQACTCREGPFLSPNAGVAENMQLKELHQMIESLQSNLITVHDQLKIRTTERDRFEESIAAADVQLKHERATRNEIRDQRDLLSKERDRLEQICQQVEQDLAAMRIERDKLKLAQCQCVPVLEERIAKLKSQLPPEMQDSTFRVYKCPEGHTLLTATNWVTHRCPWCVHVKLRSLFLTNMNNTEMLMSNPPKNAVAYHGMEILRDGE